MSTIWNRSKRLEMRICFPKNKNPRHRSPQQLITRSRITANRNSKQNPINADTSTSKRHQLSTRLSTQQSINQPNRKNSLDV
uniref:Uncharacterized protein n=1 Tax=Kalanchoe fedtschenkoi TaxID=63787 RepID=A0A7N0U3B8_KALFE